MDELERVAAIKELTKAVGKELKLDKMLELIISDDKNDDTTITLDSNYIDNPVEIVNTLTHELRHAYQHMRSEMLETKEDALFKVNYDNYISPLSLSVGGYLLLRII